MAGAFSTYLEDALINHTLRNVVYTPAATVYAALFTTNPGETGTGTEVTGGSYARTSVTFAASSGGSTSNSATVTFPTATASWGTVTYFAIYDAPTGGNELYYGALTTPKTVDVGDIFTFPSSNLSLTLD